MPIIIQACRDDRPVRFQSDRVKNACRDGHDIRPASHVTLPILIIACRDDRPVRFQSDRVNIACRDGHDIRPVAHVALPIPTAACRDDRPVRFQSNRVIIACRDFSFMQILITDLIAALERILIPNSRCKCLCRSLTVLFHKQSFALLVLQLFDLCCRVAVISSSLICRYRAVVVARRNHRFALLVLCFFGFGCRVAVIASRLIRKLCAVIVSSRHQAFALLVPHFFNFCLRVAVIASRLECRNGFVILPVLHHLHCHLILRAGDNDKLSPQTYRKSQQHDNHSDGRHGLFLFSRRFCRRNPGCVFAAFALIDFLRGFRTFLCLLGTVPVIAQFEENALGALEVSRRILRCAGFHILAALLIFSRPVLFKPLKRCLMQLFRPLIAGNSSFFNRFLDALSALFVLLFGVGNLLIDLRGQSPNCGIITRFQISLRKLQGADELFILELPLQSRQFFFPRRNKGAITPIHAILLFNLMRAQIARYAELPNGLLTPFLLLFRRLKNQVLRLRAFILRIFPACFCPCFNGFVPFLRQKLAHIRFGVLRVKVQCLFKELIGLSPLVIDERHVAALNQSGQVRIHHRRGGRGGLLDNNLRLFGLLLRAQHLLNAAQQILHEADFAHILALQVGKLLRQIIRIHAAIAGNQQTLAVIFHQREIAAPFVLDPDGVEIFRLAADDHHHLRRVERRKNIRLVLLTELILQRDAAEKHLVALFSQTIIDLLRPLGIAGALTVFVRLLVADEDVIGLFVRGNRENVLLNISDLRRLFFIQTAALRVRSILQRSEIVVVRQDGSHLHTMAGRDALARRRVFDILDAESAQHRAPVRLRVGIILLKNFLICCDCLVKFALTAIVVRTVIAVEFLLVIRLRNGRGAAAVFTSTVCRAGGKLDVPAAHFAFDNHVFFSPYFSLFAVALRCAIRRIALSIAASDASSPSASSTASICASIEQGVGSAKRISSASLASFGLPAASAFAFARIAFHACVLSATTRSV